MVHMTPLWKTVQSCAIKFVLALCANDCCDNKLSEERHLFDILTTINCLTSCVILFVFDGHWMQTASWISIETCEFCVLIKHYLLSKKPTTLNDDKLRKGFINIKKTTTWMINKWFIEFPCDHTSTNGAAPYVHVAQKNVASLEIVDKINI